MKKREYKYDCCNLFGFQVKFNEIDGFFKNKKDKKNK